MLYIKVFTLYMLKITNWKVVVTTHPNSKPILHCYME